MNLSKAKTEKKKKINKATAKKKKQTENPLTIDIIL